MPRSPYRIPVPRGTVASLHHPSYRQFMLPVERDRLLAALTPNPFAAVLTRAPDGHHVLHYGGERFDLEADQPALFVRLGVPVDGIDPSVDARIRRDAHALAARLSPASIVLLNELVGRNTRSIAVDACVDELVQACCLTGDYVPSFQPPLFVIEEVTRLGHALLRAAIPPQ